MCSIRAAVERAPMSVSDAVVSAGEIDLARRLHVVPAVCRLPRQQPGRQCHCTGDPDVASTTKRNAEILDRLATVILHAEADATLAPGHECEIIRLQRDLQLRFRRWITMPAKRGDQPREIVVHHADR